MPTAWEGCTSDFLLEDPCPPSPPWLGTAGLPGSPCTITLPLKSTQHTQQSSFPVGSHPVQSPAYQPANCKGGAHPFLLTAFSVPCSQHSWTQAALSPHLLAVCGILIYMMSRFLKDTIMTVKDWLTFVHFP